MTFKYAPPSLPGFKIVQSSPASASPDLVFVDKETSLLTTPGKTEDLSDCLLVRFQDKYGADWRHVHRLDLDTSGIVLFAKGKAMLSRCSQAFMKKSEIVNKHYASTSVSSPSSLKCLLDLPSPVTKSYVARVEGKMSLDTPSVISVPIGKLSAESSPGSGTFFNRWALGGPISPRPAVTKVRLAKGWSEAS